LLTAEQLAEWAEYYAVEPWGFELTDLQQARLMALVAQVAGAKEVTYRDFLLDRPEEAEPEEPTLEQLKALLWASE
jgi:hypothetical protein